MTKSNSSWLHRMAAITTAAAGFLSQAPDIAAAPVTAKPADAFVDSIGVNTHWGANYAWGPGGFGNEWVARFGELGIRHIREGAVGGGYANQRVGHAEVRTLIRNACAAAPGGSGKINVIVGQYWGAGGTLTTPDIDAELNEIAALGLDVVGSISGPNEWDNNHQGVSSMFTHTTDLAWADALVTFTSNLKTKVRGRGWNTELYSADVMRDDSHNALGSKNIQQYYDTLNIHLYPWGAAYQFPESTAIGSAINTVASHLDRINAQNATYRSQPRVVTEHGWNADPSKTGNGSASEESKAKYLIRAQLYHFAKGFKRSYLYSLAEHGNAEDGIALVSTDWGPNPGQIVTTKKKAFFVIRDTIAVLSDFGNASNFTPGSLDYTLSNTANIETLLLQKKNGRFYLVLWQAKSSYNQATKVNIDNGLQSVGISFPSPVATLRQIVPYNDGTNAWSTQQNISSTTLYVPDHPCIVEITPTQTSQPPLASVVNNAIYRLTPKVNTGSALDVAGFGTANGTQVQEWTWGNGANQKWKISDVGNSSYQLVPQHATGTALDVNGGGTANGTKIQIWSAATTNPNQQWKIYDMGGGWSRLNPNCAPASCLDVAGAGTANGTLIHLWQDNGGDAQRWRLQPVLPSPWSSGDVGSVGLAGVSAHDGSSTFTLRGSGGDIWNTADAFQYCYQTSTGDCEITARVTSQGNTSPWAKAGVMIRESTAAGSKHAIMVITPSNGFNFQYRTATGGASTGVAGGALNASPNNWVRLKRVGNVITAYKSANGSTWTTVGSATLSMTSSATIGLATCAQNNSALSEVKFTNVTATP